MAIAPTVSQSAPAEQFDPETTTRPDPALHQYYLVVALLSVFGFPFVFLPLHFKYRTLRYRFDDKGISMAWGLLFKREIYLTYRRIQDIHVTRNIIHRWLGLADVAVQTASGSTGAEMTIQGIRDPEGLRDFLYSKMRGARDERPRGDRPEVPDDEALALLREIRDGLVRIGSTREAGA